jgi:hypothetical protein
MEDSDAPGRLYKDLKRAGLNPWRDKESLISGQNWKNAIKNAIKKSIYFIPIFYDLIVCAFTTWAVRFLSLGSFCRSRRHEVLYWYVFM